MLEANGYAQLGLEMNFRNHEAFVILVLSFYRSHDDWLFPGLGLTTVYNLVF